MTTQHTIITAAALWNGSNPGSDLVLDPLISIEDGRIASINSRRDTEIPAGARHIDYPGAILAPAFFDVHIHGAAGHDIMEGTPEAVSKVSQFLASRGTGSYFATTVTAPLDQILRSLSDLSKLLDEAQSANWQGARPLGIHLEGPFLSHSKRGVHPPEHLLEPSIQTFDKMWQAAEGKIRLMTLAPELPGAAELAAHAAAKGVRISVGHSNATAAETRAAIAVGASSATHTFNAMRPLDHREIGILGVALTDDNLFAELICDGIHVDPALVKLWWRAKGPTRGILITDGMSATGMPDGQYMLGGFPVEVAHGKASANGVLAGSVLTLDKALTNFLQFTGASLESTLPLLSRNPAAMSGLASETGSLQPGSPASLVALDINGKLLASIVHGQQQ
ncbi:MAG TPA: N-acetylglucosamine-6-phosphate deacetylase [Acidobacteriaceae bacterium]|nr:N-acetylglucosamine-6-phosphate deacetylase [Acidobacteriaceae bacterium]